MRLSTFVYLGKYVLSSLLVENQYFSQLCSGPPNTIYIFDVSNPFAYDPTLNETWPSFFRFHFGDLSVGDTDNCYVPIAGAACTTSLLPAASFPYQSGSTLWYQGMDKIDAAVAKSANGNTYCQLSAANFNDTSSLLGFKTIFFLADQFNCYDEHFICKDHGEITYYKEAGCNSSEAVNLNTTFINQYTNYLGNISFQMKVFRNADMFYGWNQYTPSIYLVPHFRIAWDYVGLVFFVLALILALYIPASTIKRLWKKRKSANMVHYMKLLHFDYITASVLSSSTRWAKLPNNLHFLSWSKIEKRKRHHFHLKYMLILENCHGAPDSVYAFDISDPFAYDPTLNETFPSFFRFHFADYSVDDTDDCFVPLKGIACTSSLRPQISYPYSSGSTSWFDSSADISSVVSNGANGNTYCQLVSRNFSDPTTLFGFKAILLKTSDSICYDNHFTCSSEGLFSYFNESNCTGLSTSFVLFDSAYSMNDPILGNITVVRKIFTDAKIIYDWWQYTPSIALVPQFDMAIDYISALVFIIAIFIGIPIPFMTIQSIRRDKKNIRPMNYLVICSQLLVVIWSILKMIFWLVVFADYESMAIFAEIRDIFFNLGTFTSTVATGIMCNAGLFNKNKTLSYLIFTCLMVVHIVLTGVDYFSYYFNGSGLVTPFVDFLNRLNKLQYLWIVFLFAWNCSVPLLISMKFLTAFVEGTKNSDKVRTLISADRYLPYLFAGQIFAVGGYVFNTMIRNYTSWYRSDIAYQDSTGFSVFFMMLHLSLAARINESMRIVSKFKKTTFTSKSQITGLETAKATAH
ncbi:hypothetical protein HDV06_005084 [Boothiomyces sp. JEL0866]|nr:hypothetical protein HDV06_005084 [Boothiomyces sp. JEL0866]